MATKTIMMTTTHCLFSNPYSRRRRRLQPIKTGVESSFFPPKQKNLQLSRRQRRHLSLALCETKLEGLKMNSFKNVRELLLHSFVNNVVSDREFVLLMTLISPKIPTLSNSNTTRSISITSIQPNVKQSSALKKPTFLALLEHCNCLPLSTVNKGQYRQYGRTVYAFEKSVLPMHVGTMT